jgi:transposase-like protein
MATSVLNAPHFQDEQAAFAYVEERLWPAGPVCPHCDGAERLARVTTQRTKPSKRHPEGKLTVGLWRCYPCEKTFTVRVGTIFEDSHLPLHLWLQVIHLMCASKKGIATRQIQRMLNCSMKTAWFLGHRIRLAMDPGAAEPMGGAGKTVEADETELSRSHKSRRLEGHRRRDNPVVLSLVERGGNIRSMSLDHRMVGPLVREHVHEASRLVSDKAQHYKFTGHAEHESVDHSKFEWARGDVHTNTLEGFFSVFKRGLIGVYQRVDQKHLGRYLSEFDFRMNTRERLGVSDVRRAEIALQGVKGKRLIYRDSFAG